MRLYEILLKIIRYIKTKPITWGEMQDLTPTMKNVGGTFTPDHDGILTVYAQGSSGAYVIERDNAAVLYMNLNGSPIIGNIPYKAGIKYTTRKSSNPNSTWIHAYKLGGSK